MRTITGVGLAAFIACGSPDGTSPTAPGADVGAADAGDATRASWTIFVYGHADHSLSNSLVNDMAEMTRAKLSSDVRVVVLADWDASAKDATTGEAFPSGSEWYRILGNGQPPQELSKLPEQNLDDPAVLSAAIQKAFTDFPAEHYGLILWDHGGAWDNGFGGDTQDGTAQPTGIPVSTLADAIREGLSNAGLKAQKPLDFFSFDTCLMQTAEVAFAMRDFSKVYIANAEIDYGDGWNYEDTLTLLSQNTSIGPIEFARKENELWNSQHLRAGVDDLLLRAHAALDTSKLDDLATANGALIDAIAKSEGSGASLARAAYFALPAYSAFFADGQNAPLYRDYGQMLNDIGTNDSLGAIATQAGRVQDALKGAIIASSLGELRRGQLGMQIAMPDISTMDQSWMNKYKSLARTWDQASRWSAMLGGLRDAADSDGPVIDHAITNATYPDADNLPTVTITINDADVASAEFNLVQRDAKNPKKLHLLGFVTAGALAPGESYDMSWSGKIGTVGSGDDAQTAAVFPWMMLSKDGAGTTKPPFLAVPGALNIGDQTTTASLIFQDGDKAATTIVVVDGQRSAAFEIGRFVDAFPGATFAPVTTILDADDSTKSETLVGKPFALPKIGGVPIGAASAPAGKYALLTIAKDVWGNQTTAVDAVTIKTSF